MKQEKISGMVDSLKERKTSIFISCDNAMDILFRAQQCWISMRKARNERARCYRYTYGDQWSDMIRVGDQWVTEEAYLTSIGQQPLKNNLIRRLVRTVLGVYRSQMKEPTCVARDREEQQLGDIMSTLLQCNWQRNKMVEVNARTMEDFLIGGMAIHRKSYGRRRDMCDAWTDYVNPSYFFIDNIARDFRGWDVTLCGEIHDISFEDLCSSFAKTQSEYEELSKEYDLAKDAKYYGVQYNRFFGGNRELNDFLIPSDRGVCRLFEIWTKEMKSRYHCHDYADGTVFKCDAEEYDELVTQVNNERIDMARSAGVPEDVIKIAQESGSSKELKLITSEPYIDTFWYVRYITPTGKVLKEMETPYAHHDHPYVFSFYPFINGEVHSFVSDLIDQQKYINRLMTQQDIIIRSSVNGVMAIPQSSLMDDDPTGERMKRAASKPNGAYIYNDDHGRNPKPDYQSSNSSNYGIQNMLAQQLNYLEDESGVHGSLQGKQGASSVSGVLYAQQAQNSTMTLLDILDTFSSFIEESALKDVQNIQQFYDNTRVMNISGRIGSGVIFNPEMIKDVVYDVAIGESTTTPAYRQLAQDYLNQWLGAGLIDIEQALEHGNFPFGDALLQDIRTKRQQQEQQAQQAQEDPTAQTGGGEAVANVEDPTVAQSGIRPEYPGTEDAAQEGQYIKA